MRYYPQQLCRPHRLQQQPELRKIRLRKPSRVGGDDYRRGAASLGLMGNHRSGAVRQHQIGEYQIVMVALQERSRCGECRSQINLIPLADKQVLHQRADSFLVFE